MGSKQNSNANIIGIIVGAIIGFLIAKVTKRLASVISFKLQSKMHKVFAVIIAFIMSMLLTFGLVYCIGLYIYTSTVSSSEEYANLENYFNIYAMFLTLIALFTMYFTLSFKPKRFKFYATMSFIAAFSITSSFAGFNPIAETLYTLYEVFYIEFDIISPILFIIEYSPVVIIYIVIYGNEDTESAHIKTERYEERQPLQKQSAIKKPAREQFYFANDNAYRNIFESANEFRLMNTGSVRDYLARSNEFFSKDFQDNLTNMRPAMIVFTSFNLAWIFAFVNSRTTMPNTFAKPLMDETINAIIRSDILEGFNPWRQSDLETIKDITFDYIGAFIECYNSAKSFVQGNVASKALNDMIQFYELDETTFPSESQQQFLKVLTEQAQSMTNMLDQDVQLKWMGNT